MPLRAAPISPRRRAAINATPIAITAESATPGGALWRLPSAASPHPTWNRGAYLVATIGRCGYCHTPRTAFGTPDEGRLLAGTPDGPDGKKVPNITPDRETGIGKWSLDDIIGVLSDGHTPEFDFVG